MSSVGVSQTDGGGILDDPVGSSFPQKPVRRRGLKGYDPAVRRLARTNAGWCIFENDAFRGSDTEEFGPAQVRFGVRLAVDDVGGGDHFQGNWKTGNPQAH